MNDEGVDLWEMGRLADDLAKVFGAPWWRFWQRGRTRDEALHAIQHALIGEARPIQAFGVIMPPQATRSGRWRAILDQTRRFR